VSADQPLTGDELATIKDRHDVANAWWSDVARLVAEVERLRALLGPSTVEAALSALDGAAGDQREPERYRDRFAAAAADIRGALSPE
jgi:hypothetical protein